jgi:hypothetical protein
MVQLLAPDVLTAPVPAHAILHATSLDERLLLETREQFFLPRQRTSSSDSQYASDRDTWFSPAGSYFITDAAVKYMVIGQKLIRYINPAVRETMSLLDTSQPPNVIWLGIRGKKVKDAQFYFELDNATFYHYLPQAGWWCGDQRLSVKPGFNSPGTDGSDMSAWLHTPHNVSRMATRLANELFRHRFIHVLDDIQPGNGPHAPQGAPTNETLTWIKIVFPDNVATSALAGLNCQVNCFPVINRQLHVLTYRVNDWVNIIPLLCEQGQQFFDLHSIIDQDGVPFHSALLRKGGAGRFDERDVRTVTEHLLQLLRDESAAFALYDREFMAGEIKQMQQVILRLSRQMEERDAAADPIAYLEIMASDDAANRHLVVEYWSTRGAKANLIKSGTPLLAYKNGGLQQGSIFLMTATQGGRDRLLPHESLPAYKSAVLSKDRILSAEDIRLFCIREMDAKVRSIEVKKGVVIAPGRHAGYVKTIDVHISLDQHEYDSMKEKKALGHWQQLLQHQLTERSMAFTPFRVIINAI